MKNFRAIRWVLVYTMVLNLVVTAIKLGIGYLTGSLSLVADGFDSLFDGASNIVGLVGIYAAARPPDPGHPYGHRKYETLSAVSITVLLFLTTIELVQSAVQRLRHPTPVEVNPWTFVAVGASVAVHLYVAWYEYRRGKELKSEVLVADSMHTRADVLVSLSVAAGMVVVRLGYPVVDAILALLIAAVIAKIGVDIVRESSKVLADAAALDVVQVQRIVGAVPGVKTVHEVRSRGQEDDVHLDLHVRVEPGLPVEQAHHIAHRVERELLAGIEGLRDVVVHLEPQQSAEYAAPDLERRIRAIGRRLPGAAVHSVQAHEVGGQVYVTLHLEVEGALSVVQGHALASQMEDMLRQEIAKVADVDVHVEPRERSGERGSAVDEATYQKVRAAVDQATARVRDLSGCHDLAVAWVDGDLVISAHWECDGALGVEEAHALTRELERVIQGSLPDVGRVVVHVEPKQAGSDAGQCGGVAGS